MSTSDGQVPVATSTSSNPEAVTGSGLSTGAKAAIGVVIPVAVIALAASGFFLWRRKKTEKAEATTTEYSHVPQMQEHREEAGDISRAQLHGGDARMEPDSSMRYQLSDEARVLPELRNDADVEPQELSTAPSVRRHPRRLSEESP